VTATGLSRGGIKNNDVNKFMFYVYILISLKDLKLYTGYTHDLKKRYKQHCSGEVKSTKHRRPLKIIHYEAYILKDDAERREKYLKTSDGKRDIKRQLGSILKQFRAVV